MIFILPNYIEEMNYDAGIKLLNYDERVLVIQSRMNGKIEIQGIRFGYEEQLEDSDIR